MASALEVFKTNSQELRRSNDELSRFAYAASHDLKSPLRAIKDLAQWTIEDTGDQLPATAKDNLSMLLRRVDRLSRLLSDLLDYARVGHEEASIKQVDVNAMATEVMELVAPEGHFTISVESSMPSFATYDAPMRQVVMNIFSNAIKHHDRASGSIRVRVTGDHETLAVAITDDGPGIPPEFHDQVFELFKTLKPRDRVEGSGMGLAFVRKLVERYGGTVKLESDPIRHRGTTVKFTWPYFEGTNSAAARAPTVGTRGIEGLQRSSILNR